MKAITEDYLRLELRNTQPEIYYIPTGKLLTPAAREYLQQRKIKIAKEADRPSAPAPRIVDTPRTGRTGASAARGKAQICGP